MALVKYSGMSEVSGSIGGITHGRNRYGAYMRTRTNPVNPNTEEQQEVRANLSNIAKTWQGLSAAERLGWNSWASTHPVTNRLGDSIYLTGFNWFCKINALSVIMGNGVLFSAPAGELPVSDFFTQSVVTNTTGDTLSATITNTDTWANNDLGGLIISTGLPISPGRVFYKGPWQVQKTIAGDSSTPPTSPQTLTYRVSGVTAGLLIPVKLVAFTPQGIAPEQITFVTKV